MLCSTVGERAQLLEEPGPDVLLAQPIEELLHGAGVARPRGSYQHVAAVAKPHLAHRAHRIRPAASQLLLAPDEAAGLGRVQQLLAEVWMSDVDQRHRPLGQRAAEKVRRAVLGDHPTHVGSRDSDRLVGS